MDNAFRGRAGTTRHQSIDLAAGAARAAALVGALGALACQSDIDEVIEEDLVVRASFVEYSELAVEEQRIPILDGQANNLEWGSPDDEARPYTYIQVTPQSGFGDPGSSKFVAVKAAYTAQWNAADEVYSLRNMYFLLQWSDVEPSQYRDAMIYRGPNLTNAEPRVESYFRGLYPDASESEIADLVEDSLKVLLYGENDRLDPEDWEQRGGDDLLLFVHGDGDAEDAQGRSFRAFGMETIKNGSGYGPLASGFLDAWLWSASRTNPLHETFNINDIGGDADPQEGFAGYADDMYISTTGPMTLDDGPALYIPNFDTALDPEDRIPLRGWNPASDPNAGTSGNSACTQVNMGMSFPWLHRGSVRGAYLEPNPADPKILNHVPFLWETKEPEQRRLWQPGDFVTGYLLGHDYADGTDPERFTFCLPACPLPIEDDDPRNCAGGEYGAPPHLTNALDVRAFGGYDPVTRKWTLELARSFYTDWGQGNEVGNDIQDFDFELTLDRAIDFVFAIALWDNQTESGPRWGSLPVRVRVEPPPPREE